jgi:hypothetical protein
MRDFYGGKKSKYLVITEDEKFFFKQNVGVNYDYEAFQLFPIEELDNGINDKWLFKKEKDVDYWMSGNREVYYIKYKHFKKTNYEIDERAETLIYDQLFDAIYDEGGSDTNDKLNRPILAYSEKEQFDLYMELLKGGEVEVVPIKVKLKKVELMMGYQKIDGDLGI